MVPSRAIASSSKLRFTAYVFSSFFLHTTTLMATPVHMRDRTCTTEAPGHLLRPLLAYPGYGAPALSRSGEPRSTAIGSAARATRGCLAPRTHKYLGAVPPDFRTTPWLDSVRFDASIGVDSIPPLDPETKSTTATRIGEVAGSFRRLSVIEVWFQCFEESRRAEGESLFPLARRIIARALFREDRPLLWSCRRCSVTDTCSRHGRTNRSRPAGIWSCRITGKQARPLACHPSAPLRYRRVSCTTAAIAATVGILPVPRLVCDPSARPRRCRSRRNRKRSTAHRRIGCWTRSTGTRDTQRQRGTQR